METMYCRAVLQYSRLHNMFCILFDKSYHSLGWQKGLFSKFCCAPCFKFNPYWEPLIEVFWLKEGAKQQGKRCLTTDRGVCDMGSSEEAFNLHKSMPTIETGFAASQKVAQLPVGHEKEKSKFITVLITLLGQPKEHSINLYETCV